LRGDSAKARPLLEHATAVLSAGNVALMLSLSLGSSAWVLARLGDANEALSRLREGEQILARNVARGHVAVLGGVYWRLGQAALVLGRLDEARRLSECPRRSWSIPALRTTLAAATRVRRTRVGRASRLASSATCEAGARSPDQPWRCMLVAERRSRTHPQYLRSGM
jgi:hypothetical protein